MWNKKSLAFPTTISKSLPMAKKPKQRSININNRQIQTIGGEVAFWSDLYHRAMTASLPMFLLAGFALFLLNNFIFALLYSLDPAAVNNVVEPRFLNLFFFAIEAFTTVGFGNMHPASIWEHMVFSLEGFMSLVQTAALTGLIFARFSRPRARIMFADNPVVGTYEGKPHLMFRLANARQNFISDAYAQVWILRNEISADGQRFRRFHQLPLTRQQNPTFILSWTLFHTIDETSMLHNLTAEDLVADNYQFIVSINGIDDTSSQELRARKSYAHRELKWGQQYEDILLVNESGGATLDYRKFHETRA
jgi:inward rectifier potassium channel